MTGKSYFSALVRPLLLAVIMTSTMIGAGMQAHFAHAGAEHNQMHTAHLHAYDEDHMVAHVDASHLHHADGEAHS